MRGICSNSSYQPIIRLESTKITDPRPEFPPFPPSNLILINTESSIEKAVRAMGLFGSIFGGFKSSFGSSDEWYCDGCNATLHEQSGFTTDDSTWECDECGRENDVSSSNLFDSHEDYRRSKGIPDCPYCGDTVRGDAPDATYWFNCTGCRERFYLEDGELISPWSSRGKSTGSTCESCQNELSGDYTAPWEDGGNPNGYITCNSCGYRNDTEMG